MCQNQIRDGSQGGEKMMNKFFFVLPIIASLSIFGSSSYNGSTTAAVTLAGGIIKAKYVIPVDKKYKRKDCPVCKGKGWYISGDKITKVDCGYCEPDQEKQPDDCKTRVIKK